MDSTQRRMIGVAVAVCAFAVGMAGLLDYFKYRATATRLIEQRLTFVARTIEATIQSSLSLGLQFGALATLPALLGQERAGDELIVAIEVCDHDGLPLYGTTGAADGRPAPAAWLAAARRAGRGEWSLHADGDLVVGVTLHDHLGLAIGHVVLRGSGDRLRQASWGVARELARDALGVFAVAAALSSLLLLAVMRRLDGQLQVAEALLRDGGVEALAAIGRRGAFGPALSRFGESVRGAESALAEVRQALHAGDGR